MSKTPSAILTSPGVRAPFNFGWRARGIQVLPSSRVVAGATGNVADAAVPLTLTQRLRHGGHVVMVARDTGQGTRSIFEINVKSGQHGNAPRTNARTTSRGRQFLSLFWMRLSVFLRRVYLPVGYPSSVAANYAEFFQAANLQILFSHISRVHATQAMLLALGVASHNALPLAAVTAWILKDGLGHLGALAVGTVVNSRFDSDPKRFRFYSAALGKMADTVSIFTLGFPQMFLILSAVGSACGRISQSMSQTCRAKIYETFALGGNLGDVMRCSSSQATTAQLLGTSVGVALGPVVGADVNRLLLSNVLFGATSLYCSYRAAGVVELATLNLQRAELLFHDVVMRICTQEARGKAEGVGEEVDVPSIQEVRAKEVFVRPYRSVFTGCALVVNPAIEKMHTDMYVMEPSEGLRNAPFVFAVVLSRSRARFDTRGVRSAQLCLWYSERVAPEEVVRGFFFACIFRVLLVAEYPTTKLADCQSMLRDRVTHMYIRTERLTDLWWPSIKLALLHRGWRLDVAFLDAQERRISIG